MANSYNDKHRKEHLYDEHFSPVKFDTRTKQGYILEVMRMRYDMKARKFYDSRHNNGLDGRVR